MIVRRITAAFLIFVLAGMFASPALAAMSSCVVQEDGGCCCAENEATDFASVGEPGCECPACACTVEQSDAPAPFYPNAESNAPTLVTLTAASPGFTFEALAPDDRTPTTVDVRGPPGSGPVPLYILYDTLRI